MLQMSGWTLDPSPQQPPRGFPFPCCVFLHSVQVLCHRPFVEMPWLIYPLPCWRILGGS